MEPRKQDMQTSVSHGSMRRYRSTKARTGKDSEVFHIHVKTEVVSLTAAERNHLDNRHRIVSKDLVFCFKSLQTEHLKGRQN